MNLKSSLRSYSLAVLNYNYQTFDILHYQKSVLVGCSVKAMLIGVLGELGELGE